MCSDKVRAGGRRITKNFNKRKHDKKSDEDDIDDALKEDNNVDDYPRPKDHLHHEHQRNFRNDNILNYNQYEPLSYTNFNKQLNNRRKPSVHLINQPDHRCNFIL